MLQIAVCDDDLNAIDKVNGMLEKFFERIEVPFRAEFFNCGKDLVKTRLKFDLIFLDIEMKGLDGIETAKKIRASDLNVPIVYISNYTRYWRNAYQVHAFDFLEKPLKYEDIFRVLNDFIQYNRDAKGSVICFKGEKCAVMQNLNEVYYFLVESKKRIVVHTTYQDYIVKENLSDIYEKLDHTQFYMSHRSCILNFMYVDYVAEFDIIMKNGEFVPLAQKKKKDFIAQLHEYFRSSYLYL